MMLKVRTLPGRTRSARDWALFAFVLGWGCSSVITFITIEDKLLNVGLASIGLPIFMALLYWTGKQPVPTPTCLNCGRTFSAPLRGSKADGEPILYHCQPCETIWFSGDHYSS